MGAEGLLKDPQPDRDRLPRAGAIANIVQTDLEAVVRQKGSGVCEHRQIQGPFLRGAERGVVPQPREAAVQVEQIIEITGRRYNGTGCDGARMSHMSRLTN